MENFTLVRLINNADIERCFPLMQELRPSLTLEQFKLVYHEAHRADGYELISLEDKGHMVALMGYRIIWDLVHGKHLYIDDLVSSEKVRSKGYGAYLLKHAEILAKRHECKNLRLCTGIGNDQGKKFYEKNGWSLKAVAYKKKLA